MKSVVTTVVTAADAAGRFPLKTISKQFKVTFSAQQRVLKQLKSLLPVLIMSPAKLVMPASTNMHT